MSARRIKSQKVRRKTMTHADWLALMDVAYESGLRVRLNPEQPTTGVFVERLTKIPVASFGIKREGIIAVSFQCMYTPVPNTFLADLYAKSIGKYHHAT